MKNKAENDKIKSGSGLIFAVVLLFVILGMVITLSSVTVLETKMNQKTKSSVGAFYNSESGVEWALNKIAISSSSTIAGVFGGALNADHTVPTPSGTDYKVYLLDANGKVIIADDDISTVKAVRSVGTQGGETQRAIEAAVAIAPMRQLGRYCGATSTNYDGNLGGYSGADTKCAADHPGSRMCMSADFINGAPTVNGWYSSFVSSHTAAYLLDCLGWTSNAFSLSGFRLAGPFWRADNPGPWEDNCDHANAGPILCCCE